MRTRRSVAALAAAIAFATTGTAHAFAERPPAGQVLDVRVAPPGAAAVTGTLTIVAPTGDGYLSAFGCGTPPTTASVNAPSGAIVANGVTVGLAAEGRLCVRSFTTAHAVFDTTGWWS